MSGPTLTIDLPNQDWIPHVARKIWATIGADFFRALAEHLSDTLLADYVQIGELLGTPADRVKTLAVWEGGGPSDDLEYLLAGTASAAALDGGACVYTKGVRLVFPSDPLLERIGAQAYAGIPLLDNTGRPAGILLVLYKQPLTGAAVVTAMLAEVAPRATAELGRKRADDALRESEQRYRAFVARSTVAMWRIEFEQPVAITLPEDEQIDCMYRYGYLAECNDALADLLGASGADRLIGSRFGDLAPRADPRVIEELRSTIRSGYRTSSHEVRRPGPGGNPAYLMRSWWGIVENGVLCRIWGTTRDIGKLRRAQQDRRASERRFRHVLENARMAAVILDTAGQVTFSNDYLLTLTHWPAEEVLGKNWFDVMTPEHERAVLKAAFRDAIDGLQAYHHFQSEVLTRDGGRRLIEWDSTTLRDSEGTTAVGVAILGRDITDRLALEAQFRQAQKLESVARLADGVAHDFNNLLTIICGYADLLSAKFDGDDPRLAAVEEIKRAGEAGAALTRQLLTFSCKQPLNTRLLNLNDVVTENLKMLRRLIGDDVELITDLAPSLGSVVADSGQIFQVLMNLAVNSRDAMPRGGKLFITTANLEGDQPVAEGRLGNPPGPHVALTVSDTGLGMTEETKAHLFEPFYTTKLPGRGTGLGLSTVHGIVQQSAGQISVVSELGKGTTFRILFPVTSADGPAKKTHAVADAARSGTETILLVEDRADVRVLTASMLRSLGYRVLEAAGGGEARSIIEHHGEPIHLLISDIEMPGMAGTELVAQVKAAHSEIKVLYMSARNAPAVDENFIQKPFTLQALGSKVREALGPVQ
jgi:hypothetical protein